MRLPACLRFYWINADGSLLVIIVSANSPIGSCCICMNNLRRTLSFDLSKAIKKLVPFEPSDAWGGRFWTSFNVIISDYSFTPSLAISSGDTEPMRQTNTILKVCSVLSTAAASLHFILSTVEVLMPGCPMPHKGCMDHLAYVKILYLNCFC